MSGATRAIDARRDSTPLQEILDRAKAKGDGHYPITHTSFSGGKYVLWHYEYAAFIDAYAGDVVAGGRHALVERRLADRGPVLVDLDFRQADGARKYTNAEHVQAFASALFQGIRNVAQHVRDADLTCYVLEKPTPRPCPNGRGFKDGLHMIIPGVVLRSEAAMSVRDEVMPVMPEVFGGCGFTNSWDDVYDASVLKAGGGNGWMMFGSLKPDEPVPWTVTGVLKPTEDGTAVFDAAAPHASMSVHDKVALFSVRNKHLTHRCSPRMERLMDAIAPVAPAGQGDRPPHVPVHADVLEDIVSNLDPRRACAYADWHVVVFAIRNTCLAAGLAEAQSGALVHRFSALAPVGTYSATAVDAWLAKNAYATRGPGSRTAQLGSLLMWVKADAPQAWATSIRDRLPRSQAVVVVGDAGNAGNAGNAADAADDETAQQDGWRHDRMVAALLALRNGTSPFAALEPDAVDFRPVGKDIHVSHDGVVVAVIDTTHGDVTDTDGCHLGMFMGSLPFHGSLSSFHPAIHKDVTSWLMGLDMESATFSSTDVRAQGTTLMLGGRGAKPPMSYLEVTYPSQARGGAPKVIRVNTNKLMPLMGAYVNSTVEEAWQNVYGVTINNNNQIIGQVNIGQLTIASEDGSEWEQLRDKVFAHATLHGLRKRDGNVYEPVRDCPCAYVLRSDFKVYINQALKHDAVYYGNHKRYREVHEFLTNYCDLPQFPELVTDSDLISFSNGVVVLTTGQFTPYVDVGPESSMGTRTARHHIPLPYTGNHDTPHLDTVLDHQFTRDVAEVLVALLIGRVLFKVGQLDGWQVMPYLVGVGGTGKGLLLTVAERLFAPGTIGILSPSKREETFGMSNLTNREIVLGKDMPHALSKVLQQELLQSMTSGEYMEVSVKGGRAETLIWTTPVVMASNWMPDYVNNGNNVGRRLVSFRFDNVVTEQLGDLQQRVLGELPNILCRGLRAYADLRRAVEASGHGFWKSVPPKLVEWQGMLSAATNPLHEFLLMEDAERGCSITCVKGRVTLLVDFQAAFKAKMVNATYKSDPAVFQVFGFTLSPHAENVCRSCKQIAASQNGARCCEQYSQKNRSKNLVIRCMDMQDVSPF